MPLICGLKLTHDGAVALIDGNKLVGSVECEKADNNRRYAALGDLSTITRFLDDLGADLTDVEHVAIDGWVAESDGIAKVRLPAPAELEQVLRVAPYTYETGADLSVYEAKAFLGDRRVSYRSYPHALDHVYASYCSSPHAVDCSPALVLVWDGGMPPTLYEFDGAGITPVVHGPVLNITGAIYPLFAATAEVFREAFATSPKRAARLDYGLKEAHLSLSGKAMAYAGLGGVDETVVDVMNEVTAALAPTTIPRAIVWSRKVRRAIHQQKLEASDATIVASFQEWLYRNLEAALRRCLGRRWGSMPLCLGGGCALNIKWNSALRSCGGFTGVWVPPFPNDCGNAIGAACAEMARATGSLSLEWDVFSGPQLTRGTIPDGWASMQVPVEKLAEVLHEEGEPVVVLSGRAELGPRALGHRSIIAPATDAHMQDHLNTIKGREWYRPVAPICLEGRATEVFDPGTPDPFMLFDHDVRSGWRERIPAVIHADGTARLQTVTETHDVLYPLLSAYEKLSGIPVLCNTSANLKGCGFFPDAESAMKWGGAHYVWADGTLYSRRS